jgi:hypothetical protein
VTSVDVNNLIPVVSESLTGGEGFGTEPAGNVWASGAATAAFDAFGDHAPAAAALTDTGPTMDHVITQPDHIAPAGVDDYFADTGLTAQPLDDASLQLSNPVIDDAPPTHADFGTEWATPAVDDHHHDDGGAAFDLFS